MTEPFTPPSIMIGVDGSPDAVRAALWAIPEALSRDIALRLICVADSAPDGHPEQALKTAVAAVRSANADVTVEIAVLAGEPGQALLEQSRTAAMICVGAVGLRHLDHSRAGSTARLLATSAHCPVAVVRGSAHAENWVVVELDATSDSATVLQSGVEEARLRRAPLRVLGGWQSRVTDAHDVTAVADGNRLVRAQLDRRLSEWKLRYPDLDVEPVAVHGSMLHYIERHAAKIQLIVVGAQNTAGVGELLGPPGLTALHDTDCSVLVIDRQRLL
ncbi:MAG: universal stress protein [Mycobacterium sp.]